MKDHSTPVMDAAGTGVPPNGAQANGAQASAPNPRRDLKGERRRANIIDLLSADTSTNGTVTDFAETLGVSVATIRRDLGQLEDRQLITRTYGGAALTHARAELTMIQRESTYSTAKRGIGRAAAALVADGDLIILDAGSTTEQVAAALGNRAVTVVTNGLRVINRLVAFDHVRVLVLGGTLRGFNETIFGSDAEAMLGRVFAKYAFIGGDGVDARRGVASRTYEQARIKSLMMANAAKVFVVADSSKLTGASYQYWSPLPATRWGLITNHHTAQNALSELRTAGVSPIITT